MNIALIMMGGNGSRLGEKIPKQFIRYDGKPLYFYTLEKYLKLEYIELIVLIVHSDWIEFVKEEINQLSNAWKIKLVSGGNSRSESVKNGLFFCSDFAEDDDIVLIHDITHPYVDVEKTEELINKTKIHGAGTLVSAIYDTTYEIKGESLISKVIPREKIMVGASPEAFKYGLINPIYKSANDIELRTMTSVGAIALRHGIRFCYVKTELLNLKITYQTDFDIFKRLNGKI